MLYKTNSRLIYLSLVLRLTLPMSLVALTTSCSSGVSELATDESARAISSIDGVASVGTSSPSTSDELPVLAAATRIEQLPTVVTNEYAVVVESDLAGTIDGVSLSSPPEVAETESDSEMTAAYLIIENQQPEVTTDPNSDLVIEESPPAGLLELALVEFRVEDIRSIGASVYWRLNRKATGQVEFGTTPDFGRKSTLEDSFIYSEHQQLLENLEPGTTYYYRVLSKGEDDSELVSDTQSFRTSEQITTAESPASVDVGTSELNGWPAGANGDLPLGGIFYGNASTAQLITNSPIAVQSSRRFRAERTGNVVALRFQNRVLTDALIKSRCSKHGSGSVWCDCQVGGLDAYTCGYSTGSMYSVGNGGLLSAELRPDDGNGSPTNEVLAKTDRWIPQDLQREINSANVTFPLLSPGPLRAGNIYHIVLMNAKPPSTCNLKNHTIQEAANCPRDEGAMGFNGVYDVSRPISTGRWGPFRGNASANLHRNSDNESWIEAEKALSFYELHYSDGVKVGDTYHSLDSTAEQEVIGGSTQARQTFTVRDVSREVTGVWVNFSHSSNANGSALDVYLKDAGGNVLSSGKLAASDHCIAEMQSGNSKCRDWHHADFGETVSLIQGSDYALEMSGSSGAGFVMTSYQPLIAHGYEDRNYWNDARAELSTNGGNSWAAWSTQLGDHRDMGMLFTIEGMPTQLP